VVTVVCLSCGCVFICLWRCSTVAKCLNGSSWCSVWVYHRGQLCCIRWESKPTNGPCRCRTTGQHAGELVNSDCKSLRTPACIAFGDFLEVGHFAPFSVFWGSKVSGCFYPFTSTYDPYERWKVSWKSVRTFLRNPEDRQTRQLDIYIYIGANLHFWNYSTFFRAVILMHCVDTGISWKWGNWRDIHGKSC